MKEKASKNRNAKFTASEVREIRSLAKQGMIINHICKKFNVKHCTIKAIVNGTVYKNVE